jgi:GT2 family glycosyltransferase
MTTPLISTVIPSRDGRDLLARCLPALRQGLAAVAGEHEIIVVDSASEDDSIAWLRAHHPEVRVVPQPPATSFASACNAGIAAAAGRYLLLLNNDMLVAPDFLAPLVAPFDDANVFAVAAQYRMRRGLIGTYLCGICGGPHPEDAPVTHAPRPRIDAPAGGGLFDREKLVEIGGFDPLFHPFYWEDTDLGFRAWRRGWSITDAPQSAMYHEESATLRRLYRYADLQAIYQKNQLLFAWKNLQAPHRLTAHLLGLPRLVRDDLLSRGGLVGMRGLLGALRQLPEAMRARGQQRQRGGLSEAAILRRVPQDARPLLRQVTHREPWG